MNATLSGAAIALVILATLTATETTNAASSTDVAELERRLAAAQADLQKARERIRAIESDLAALNKELKNAESRGDKISVPIGSDGVLEVGGAMRVNYTIGSYGDDTGSPSRADGDGGNFSLDTMRLDARYVSGSLGANFQYRFYDGYHVLHTAELGYRFKDDSRLKVGVTRVPFGPADFGTSKSWFFDQHFYVGLADDMDLGIHYSQSIGDTAFDIAYFLSDEGSWAGGSRDSARYAYDVVNESNMGYEERGQFNLRGIHHVGASAAPVKIGLSLQYGRLDSRGVQPDGDGFAASAHVDANLQGLTVVGQLTRYRFDVSADQPLGTDELVQFGGFDGPATVASAAWIPAVSLSYELNTDGIAWLDCVIPYLEYSAVVKDERLFNDSELFVLGAAWKSDGWYIYSDLAVSNGNEFVGGESEFGDRLGANLDDQWQYRFNLNLGYSF